MATVRSVADLRLVDANNRQLRRADGTAEVNPKHPEARYFRIRWYVTDRTDVLQILIGVDRATLARSAHQELVAAFDQQVAVDADG